MSQLGTISYFRADDSQYRATLRSMDQSASTAFSRIGESAKDSFKGVFQAKEAFSRSFGLITSALTGFGAVAAMKGLVAVASDWVGHSQVVAFEAEREQAARAKTLDDLHRSIESMKVLSDYQRQLIALEGGRSVNDPLRELVNRAAEKRAKVADDNPFSYERIVQAYSTSSVFGGPGGMSPWSKWKMELTAATDEYAELLEMLRRSEREMDGVIKRQASELRAAQTLRVESMTLNAKAALEALTGSSFAADRLREVEDFHKRTADILKLIADGEVERGFELASLDQQRHEARMRQIDEQEAAQKRRDAEKANALKFENTAALDLQEIERLRLTGQEDAAKALQAQVEHRRALRSIEAMEGLTDAEKSMRKDIEDRNFDLRLAQLRGAGASGRTLAAPTGLLSFASLRTTVGGVETWQQAQAREALKHTRLMEETNELLRLINGRKPEVMVARLG